MKLQPDRKQMTKEANAIEACCVFYEKQEQTPLDFFFFDELTQKVKKRYPNSATVLSFTTIYW